MSSAHQTAEPHPRRLGKYEIVKHIASGGMGSVYKAVDTTLGRPVAVKVLFAELAAMPVMVERFHREAKAAANFAHENIVTLLDHGEEDGTHYLVMEFVEGIDLDAYITKKTRVEPEDARRILVQAARALEHAHRQGVVHRDIKPSNFLLTKKDGKLLVKLTDMGLARRVDDREFRVTKDGTTVGTVDYISPEQAHDAGKADTRSDIYSLGCTFFHMLAGEPPFAKGSLAERIMGHLKAPPPDICKLNAEVPAVFDYILKRMLAKKPKDRYQTPKELLKDLEHPERIDPAANTPVKTEERLALLEDLVRAEGDGGSSANKSKSAEPGTQDGTPSADAPLDKKSTSVIKKTRVDVAEPQADSAEGGEPEKKERTSRNAAPEKKKSSSKKSRREDEKSDREDEDEDGFEVPWWVFAGAGVGMVLLLYFIFG
jgi:serine/threonine-protein kinase